MAENDGRLWTVVSLQNELFALPVDQVQTMALLPPVTSIPDLPEHVRGVFVLRGDAVPVIDLRTRLGMPTLHTEVENLITMLEGREQDHRNWLNELEASVRERREFKLTTDPHACAFGKWYDSYKTDSILLQGLLKRFDAPHKRIHAIAEEVLAFEKADDLRSAQELLDKTRDGDLAEMIRLFAQLKEQVRESTREIAVVLSADERTFAVAVDSVETVGRLMEDATEDIAETGLRPIEEGLVMSVGRLDKSGRLVIILDCGGILAA